MLKVGSDRRNDYNFVHTKKCTVEIEINTVEYRYLSCSYRIKADIKFLFIRDIDLYLFYHVV